MAFKFTIERTYRLDREDRGLLLGAAAELAVIREGIMALSKEVQDVLDRTRQATDLVKSLHLGMQALAKQNSELQDKINSVPVAPAPAMSQEDKDALAEVASDQDNMIVSLQSDIPANTPQDRAGLGQGNAPPKPAPETPQLDGLQPPAQPPQTSSTDQPPSPDQSAGAAPDLSNDSQHKADAEAASQAKPLAGTGQG